jgi:hypothetical protein
LLKPAAKSWTCLDLLTVIVGNCIIQAVLPISFDDFLCLQGRQITLNYANV